MRRWVLRPGATGLDQLQLDDVSMPEPGPGEVRVRVRSVSLNYRDQLILSGSIGVTITEDLVPISDGAGEIDAVGEGVDKWVVGDRITGLYFGGWREGSPRPGMGRGLGSPGEDGMLAEYVVLKADRVARMPESYSFDQASTLPCAALTAWSALKSEQPVRPEDKVLVTGTGGVALFALLFARSIGAEVIATTGQEAKVERVRELGAADVINYHTTGNWGEVAFERTGGLDKVINAAGGDAMAQSVAAIGYGGEIAVMGLFSRADQPITLPSLMARGASIRGISVGSSSDYDRMVASINALGVVPPIDRVFPFEQAKEAYQAQISSSLFGKIVIQVAP